MPDAKPRSVHDVPDLSSRTVAVTGCASSIGYEAALVFATRHANVVIVCRSLDRRTPQHPRAPTRIRAPLSK
jgi:NAD(P)-dependent dehydrogenase (short-subunit alcohol dehydrogenase family)